MHAPRLSARPRDQADAPAASTVVMKFGGTSMAGLERIREAARRVAAERGTGARVAVVVSAMSGETDRLVGLCREAAPLARPGEYDVVVSSGEQVTAGLLAIVLEASGVPARSLMGWQVPLETTDAHGVARITGVGTARLGEVLDAGAVAVVPGFQGVAPGGRMTTLGRGGSDTSAVALAAALGAGRCDIYTDVEGVFTTDPRIVPRARRLERITYEEMLELASVGAKVLQTRSVELAMKEKVRVRVLSSFADGPGTLLVDEEEGVEDRLITGVAYDRNEAKLTVAGVPDRPGAVAGIFGPLADAGINVDMIVQNVAPDGRATDVTFTVPRAQQAEAEHVLGAQQQAIGFAALLSDDQVAKVSVVGVGMRSHAGVAATMFRALADRAINIQAITTSEIKVSVLIAEEYLELAVRALHSAYGLDEPA